MKLAEMEEPPPPAGPELGPPPELDEDIEIEQRIDLITRARRAQLMRENARSRSEVQRQSQANKRTAHGLPVRTIPHATGCRGLQVLQALELQWRPGSLPSWVQRIHSSHTAQWLGGVVGCTTCGGMCATPTGHGGLLQRPCRRTIPDGSRSHVGLFARGMRPTGFPAWPDGRAAPDAIRAHVSLEYRRTFWAWAL